MRYTPGQLRDIVGISQETFRHWRTTIEPLQGARGHAPIFKAGQVLAVAIIKAAVEQCGVSIRTLQAVAPAIFDVCDRPNWEVLSHSRIALELQSGTAKILDEPDSVPSAPALILIAMTPIIARLREALFDATPVGNQDSLRFPPVALKKNRTAALGRGRS